MRFPCVLSTSSLRLVGIVDVPIERRGSHVSSEQRGYMSYLLRLWQIRSGGELVWRASLECPHTGERVSFASLDDLFGFLWRQIGECHMQMEGRATAGKSNPSA